MTEKDFEKIIQMGIAITVEKDSNKLLDSIVESGMEITHCDASTLYLYEDGVLKFKIMKTISQNIDRGRNGEPLDDMPPVPFKEENVCAYTAIHRKIVNIPDVYHNETFDFSGPKRYDALTGYRTQSLLVIPLEDNNGELLGVLQMLNAQDADGNVIPFENRYEIIIRSLGSMAAVEMANIRYMEEIKAQLRSFVEAMATAIDHRTPYNGSHTRKVAEYALVLAKKINEKQQEGLIDEYFDESRLENLELAALLHDIGKMIVPRSVMNRATRLDWELEPLKQRYRLISAYLKMDCLRGRITKEVCERECAYLQDAAVFVERINGVGFLPDEDFARVREIAEKRYESEEGEIIPYLTDRECECLSIRKGTLTKDARIQMENHVVMTADILSKVHFNKNYASVPKWAGEHHEFLDGSGYPKHLTADELELETRILTVLDIYDALTSQDRPYKKPIPKPKAFAILHSMAEEGKIEDRLVSWLEEALDVHTGT